MALLGPLEGKLVVLIGGGGFLGSYLVQGLLRRGARVRIAERHPESAFDLKPLAELGHIQFARCDVKNRRSLERVLQGADAAAYLVGTWGADQHAIQAEGAGVAAGIAAENGAQAFAYVSAIGADANSDSGYASSKGEGEDRVLAAFPKATIVRPSVMFGEDDKFVNMFGGLIAALPLLPIFGADAKLQPVFVDDVAEAIANALADAVRHGGKVFELAGPEVLTMQELHQRISTAQGRERRFVAMPDGVSGLFAALPGTPMNTDQWNLLKRGNVASGDLPGCEALGIQPRPLGLFLDRWMTRYRKQGRFGDKRELA